jgi:hypothetical protein
VKRKNKLEPGKLCSLPMEIPLNDRYLTNSHARGLDGTMIVAVQKKRSILLLAGK